ncbi:uncharacterized protein LOC131237755 [Magnolia sinica]|uniref:uncharacterized protein LOC131237755 n=1 Tax=Magnolia sinica TaxID=86752 RepID=UPI00265AA9C7|nr:uncharacterized protein LOC131237755 [Magnolia sinica]
MAVLFFSPTTFTSSLSNPKPYNPPPSFNPTCSNLHRPSSHPVRISRSQPHICLQIAHHMLLAPKCTLRPSMAAGLEDMNSELPSESELPLESEPASSSHTEASFDIKLPRRSLLVQFTCNACGERTQRTINRAAYERGTVFVQLSSICSPSEGFKLPIHLSKRMSPAS